MMYACCWLWRKQFEICRGPQGSSQDFSEPETIFSGKFFKLVDKFEALLKTQVAEVGCSALEKTSLIRNYSLLLNFESDFCWLSEPETGHVAVSNDDKDGQEG